VLARDSRNAPEHQAPQGDCERQHEIDVPFFNNFFLFLIKNFFTNSSGAGSLVDQMMKMMEEAMIFKFN
jgi:hypothetical protein